MAAAMDLDNRANLSSATLSDLEREIAGHLSLVDALGSSPAVVDVVVQDEYTHDVVLGGRADGLFLVYDTT